MQQFKLWDGAVRLFHWSQVALLGGLWWSAEQEYYNLHMVLAYSLASVLLARLIWAVVGSENARFSHFVKSPATVWRFIRQPSAVEGHNPLSGYMIVALLLLVLAQFVTGLMTTDDVFTEGPLVAVVDSQWVQWASAFHRWNLDILLALVAIHVLAALIHQWRGDKIISAMLHGKKALTTPVGGFKAVGWYVLLVGVIAAGLFSWQGYIPLQALIAGQW
jgi:cytochrome b